MSDCLWPHGLQHARPPCPSPSPGACSNSGPSSQWCRPPISSSAIPCSSCLQYFPPSGSFPVSQPSSAEWIPHTWCLGTTGKKLEVCVGLSQCLCVCAELLQHAPLCSPMDCRPQAPLPVGFSRQESWGGWPSPEGLLPVQGLTHASWGSWTATGLSTSKSLGKPVNV